MVLRERIEIAIDSLLSITYAHYCNNGTDVITVLASHSWALEMRPALKAKPRLAPSPTTWRTLDLACGDDATRLDVDGPPRQDQAAPQT